jgi:hypothetical protein
MTIKSLGMVLKQSEQRLQKKGTLTCLGLDNTRFEFLAAKLVLLFNISLSWNHPNFTPF